MRDEKNNNNDPSKSSQQSFYKCQLKWKEKKNTIGSIHSQMRKWLDIIKFCDWKTKQKQFEIICFDRNTMLFIIHQCVYISI